MSAINKAVERELERIRKALKDRMYTKVAEATGLHVNTISAIAKNDKKTPSMATISKLSEYLFGSKA